MIFRKAVKDDFDNIKSLYWELIDQEQGDPSFPHWKKGIHPSDEMLRNSIGKEELYVLADGSEIAACAIVNDEKVDGYADVRGRSIRMRLWSFMFWQCIRSSVVRVWPGI